MKVINCAALTESLADAELFGHTKGAFTGATAERHGKFYVADGATLSDPRLVNHLKAVGDAYKITYQLRQPGGGGTDAGAIHKQLSGIPSVSVSVPCRYLHTAASLTRLADWRNSIALIHAALTHIDKDTLKTTR